MSGTIAGQSWHSAPDFGVSRGGVRPRTASRVNEEIGDLVETFLYRPPMTDARNNKDNLGGISDSGSPLFASFLGTESVLSGPINASCSNGCVAATSVIGTATKASASKARWKNKKNFRRRKLTRARKVKFEAKAPRNVNIEPAILGDLVPDMMTNGPDGVFVHTQAQNEPDTTQGTAGQSGSGVAVLPGRLVSNHLKRQLKLYS